MRRIKVILAVVALLVAMMVFAAPAMAVDYCYGGCGNFSTGGGNFSTGGDFGSGSGFSSSGGGGTTVVGGNGGFSSSNGDIDLGD